ncbi:MAG: IS110 family transposase [Gemmatimonadaceae bacterium]
MDTIGLDLHKRESQLCIIGSQGEITEKRITTSRERFTAVLGRRERCRILLEASTESEWVARHLESLGHEVIVADPGFAPMYATRSKKVKTDKRDARTLAEACTLGAYRSTHRVSAEQRHVRSELLVRDALVRTRTRYVALIKAAVRREGLRLSQGEAERTALKVGAIELREEVLQELAPILDLLSPLNREIGSADKRIEQLGRRDPVVERLMTAPGVGPVTALAFVASLDQVARFSTAHQVESYLGLVPSEFSSGERQHRGRITKRGNARMRSLLVEAGWRILRSRRPECAALRAWALQIAARRGKRIAVVALARRLSGILFAMWRDGNAYRAPNVKVGVRVEGRTAAA